MQVSIEEGRQQRVGSERWNCLCPGCLRSNLEREASIGYFNSLIAALLRARRANSVTAPAPDIHIAATLPEGAGLSGEPSFIFICLKMPQWIRSCKQIRPWFNKSGLKILSLKSEVLWPWASDCQSLHPRLGSDFFKTQRQVDSAPAAFTLNRVLPTRLQLDKPALGAWTDLRETWPHARA